MAVTCFPARANSGFGVMVKLGSIRTFAASVSKVGLGPTATPRRSGRKAAVQYKKLERRLSDFDSIREPAPMSRKANSQ